MREYVCDIEFENLQAWTRGIELGIYELGAPRNSGWAGVYRLKEETDEV